MKDLLSVQDYLFSAQDVGDWEGDEDEVTETLNDLTHIAWDAIPEDCNTQTVDKIMHGLWQQLRGDLALVEADFSELTDWVHHYVSASLERLSDEHDDSDELM